MTLDNLKKIFACFEVTFPMSLTWHYSSSCASCSQGTVTNTDCAGNIQWPVLGSEALFPQQTLQSELVGTENKPLALTGHTSTQTHRHRLSHFLSVHWKPTVSPCLDGCFWRSTSIKTKILCLEASPVQRGLRCTAVNFWQ